VVLSGEEAQVDDDCADRIQGVEKWDILLKNSFL